MRRGRAPLPRRSLIVVSGLLLLSTALLGAGISRERSELAVPVTRGTVPGEAQEARSPSEPEGAHVEASEPAGAHDGSAEGAAHSEAEEERLFGLDLESPTVLLGVIVGTLLLVAALYFWGYPVLWLILGVAVASVLLDLREFNHQLAEGRSGLATMALVVALAHVATAVACLTTLRARPSAPPPAPADTMAPS